MSGVLSTPSPGGGIIPPGAQAVAPQAAGLAQQYGQMSPEQLQQIVARAGTQSPYGQIASRILMQKRIMPNAGMQANPQAAAPQAPPPVMPQSQPIQQTVQATNAGISLPPSTAAMAKGGGIAPQHFDMGGMPQSQQDPWWTRSEARGEDSGLIHAYSPGRTDTMNMEPLAGSYIIPADVISGLGEGNTLAGAAVMDRVLNSGPHGTPLPRGQHGKGPPEPPRIMRAAGGQTEDATGERVPIVAAGGEYKVSPDQVARLGDGNVKKGHDLLDAFCLEVRKRTVKDLKKLPAPKKD